MSAKDSQPDDEPAGERAEERAEERDDELAAERSERANGEGARGDVERAGGMEMAEGEGRGGAEGEDLLRRAAAVIRAEKRLEAFVPMSPAERASLVDDVMAAVMKAEAEVGAASSSGMVVVGTGTGSATGSGTATASASSSVASASSSVASASSSVASASSSVASASSPAAPAAPILPLHRRSSVRIAAGAALSLAALAATLALLLRGREPAPSPLATYAMLVEGERATRGEPASSSAAPVEVRPQTQLSIALTPARAERDALVRLVLVRGERAVLLEPSIQTRRDGALAITGAAVDLLGPQGDGEVQLIALLGRQLPDDESVLAIARGQRAPPTHVQRLAQTLRLVGFSHSANSSAPPEALLAGCRAVLAGQGSEPPLCQVSPSAPLQLWVSDVRDLQVLLDGELQDLAGAPRGGGTLLPLPVSSEVRLLSVRAGGVEVLARRLSPSPTYPWMTAFDAAVAEQRLDRASAALPQTAASPEEDLELARRRAKVAWRQGRLEAANQQRARAVELARQLGNLSAESDEIVAQLYGLIDDHQLAAAAQLVTALDRHGAIYPEGAMYRDLTHGRLASELGDLGAALGWMRRAQSIAARLDHARAMGFIRAPLGEVLASLGRSQEVRALAEEEVERGRRDADPCARVDALTSSGWLLRDADRARAQQLVDEAVELADARCAERAPIALVNRGWLLAESAKTEEARQVLARLESLPPDGEGRVLTWQLRLEAEVLLGEDARAAERYAQKLLARADALCSAELRYEALLLRGRSQHARGERAAAMASFDEAERALAQWSRTVPLGEGRETFFRRHDQLALAAIPLLLEQIASGDRAAELQLAQTVRRSLARFASSLAGGSLARASAERGDRERDQLSAKLRAPDKAHCAREPSRAEPLPPLPAPSQSSLFLHPTPRGWIAVAWRGSQIAFVETERLGAGGAELIAAAAPLVAPSHRVHLYVHRTLAALPLDRLLAARLAAPEASAAAGAVAAASEPGSVAFAVDTPPRERAACTAAPRALLVSNPQGNLWAASESVPTLRAALARRGFTVELLEGRAATRAALEARLADPCVQLFHYDGHGAASATSSILDRVDDALLLAGGERLTAAGVLGLPRVPPAVVLNGCTTAAPEGLGLAQAFLVAGASQVVASLDELGADEAARFTRALYRDEPGSSLDLVQLFAKAIAAHDVPAMRAFER